VDHRPEFGARVPRIYVVRYSTYIYVHLLFSQARSSERVQNFMGTGGKLWYGYMASVMRGTLMGPGLTSVGDMAWRKLPASGGMRSYGAGTNLHRRYGLEKTPGTRGYALLRGRG
jgi:hypothetical protein